MGEQPIDERERILATAIAIADAIGARDVARLGTLLSAGFVHRKAGAGATGAAAFLAAIERIPGEILAVNLARIEIDMWSTAMTFRAGTRLRVLVTSSDFPRYDRNPNTGRLSFDSAELRPATQTIFRDAMRASHILLPIAG